MISIAKPNITEAEISAVTDVLKSGRIAQGKVVAEFEENFAEYNNSKYAIALSSGTSALDLSMKALDIGPGDEVITTPFTFIATGNSILFQKAKPVFVDINPKTFNIDPEKISEAITDKTVGVMPVHLYGNPCDMNPILEICDEKNLFVVEDCAQAHGAEYNNKKVGTFGKCGCYSFYPTKNMTTGEGGMITTDDEDFARKIKLLRDHGSEGKYNHILLGYNTRMTNFAAAIGLEQLKKLNAFNEQRIQNAKYLDENLKNASVTIPYKESNVKHVYHQYTILSEERDALKEHLTEHEIGSAVYYSRPLYSQPLYKDLGYNEVKCPITEEACNKVLSIPVHPLISQTDLEKITSAIKEF